MYLYRIKNNFLTKILLLTHKSEEIKKLTFPMGSINCRSYNPLNNLTTSKLQKDLKNLRKLKPSVSNFIDQNEKNYNLKRGRT